MSQKYTVRLEPLGKILKVNKGTPLIDILSEYGVEFPCGGRGTCYNCKVRIIEGDIETEAQYKDILLKKGFDSSWRLACKSCIIQDVVLEIAQTDILILADNTVFSFKPGRGYGLAIDLGTTTIVMQMVNLSNGHVLDALSAINLQSRYGADIMSRISYAQEHSGLEMLCHMIRSQLWNMMSIMIKRHNIIPATILLVGNTLMHHLFSCIDVRSLAFYPFETHEGGKKQFRAKELGWDLPENTKIAFMPALGSFVGSDILAGILATGMDKSEDLMALIDLGTNGEIVVGNRDLMLTASTAAGPAFEGTHISQGMRAANGAISSVFLRNNEIAYHVIGNEIPRGICGSGIIDAVSVFLQTNQINEAGQISSGKSWISVTDTIKLTQKDIYEYILAKAAIASGIHILLNMLGKSDTDLKMVFIAGGFGNFITIDNAIITGLLEFPGEKILKAGNTALIGAKMLLFKTDDSEQNIVSKTRHISLESDTGFQDIFVSKMMLEKT
ncbi:MAG: DUF4445 domain-containing protein [Bacteroidales bacterium]|nr:DUF4445 domain-containing protein [Bacteroidales bacterium]MBN2764352.1 DUF4445 domain-containing protein [Bacteroidales bacterium]